MKWDMTKVVEEIVTQCKETEEEFIFETIHPYCENILQMKINKEELKQILLNGMQKQQPCEDCISRASIKQKLQEHRDFYVNACGGFSNLPRNTKSRVDEIDNCIAMVVNEPSVTPQRPKGKWIDVNGDKSLFECSKCGDKVCCANNNYCPNCGAEMEEGGEDEDGKSL